MSEATNKMEKEELPPMDLKPTRPSMIRSGPLGFARIMVGWFSRVGVREPPSSNKTTHVRLITIPASHYCEKARWGLDLLEQDPNSSIYYTEDGHPPGLLSFATLEASNSAASASPMIVSSEESVVVKSDQILQEYCPFLYPPEIAQEVMQMEDDLGRRLGASVRCLLYYYMLDPSKTYYPILARVACKNTSKIEEKLFTAMIDKGIDRAIKKTLKINDETAMASTRAIRQVFEEMSCLLEKNGGEYLLDTPTQSFGLTAADISLAALGAPLIRVPCLLDNFSAPADQLPKELIELGLELQETLAGKHILKIYERHRPTVNGIVVVKTCDRDCMPWKEIVLVAGLMGSVALAIMARRRSA